MWDTDEVSWSRLDNAARIFAPTSTGRDSRVFRFSCELTEDVNPGALQTAVNTAIEEFPNFRCVMRRGVFWHYLEQCSLSPEISEESGTPCRAIYNKSRHTLLFRVTYYKKRINLEMYHVLSDGTGALQFLKTIVFYYLSQLHSQPLKDTPIILDYDASHFEKSADSFRKYYNKHHKRTDIKEPYAYMLKGTPTHDSLHLIEGVLPSSAMLTAARERHTSVTALITAILMLAIREEMPVKALRRPVVISVPVNLRKYFKSETSRNFFGMINIEYDFKNNPADLDSVLKTVDQTFKRELTAERLSLRMNKLVAVEHNLFSRISPLPLKNFVLNIARHISDRKVTAVISNVGRVKMPEALTPYIRLFDFFTATLKTQLCMCSFEDQMVLSFSSSFEETDLPRRVFRSLAELGMEITISSNTYLMPNEQKGSDHAVLSEM